MCKHTGHQKSGLLNGVPSQRSAFRKSQKGLDSLLIAPQSGLGAKQMCLFFQREFLRIHLKFRHWALPLPSPSCALRASPGGHCAWSPGGPLGQRLPGASGRGGEAHSRPRACLCGVFLITNTAFLCPFPSKDGMNWVCKNVIAKKK